MKVKLIKPNNLRMGDRIGLVSPSAPLVGLVPHRVVKRRKNVARFMI